MKWVIFMMLMYPPAAVPNSPEFTNESGCHLYLHTVVGEQLTQMLKLKCVNVTPPTCQGRTCP